MAQFVTTAIDIEGKNIKQFSSFTLNQGLSEHHTFRLVCPSEAIDSTNGTIFNSSKNMVGASIKIQIAAVGSSGTLQFAGLITQVEASRFNGHTGDIILSGYSPTILMDNGPHCKSWEKKAIKDVAQDVLKNFPQNLLQPSLSPVYTEVISYLVQYKETAWQFLNRVCAAYGEWFYYTGKKLILGPPQGNDTLLIYGNNLTQFNTAIQVKPASFQMMAYDYLNHEVYSGSPNNIAANAGLNELGKHVLQKSEAFYSTQPKQWHNQFLKNKKQLDDYVNTRAAMRSSNMVRISGSSSHPGVQVAGNVKIQGKNVFSLTEEAFGDYTVISVKHQCDGQGNYTNEFEAIPASVKFPPATKYIEPPCETQSAVVTDNHDEEGLGRVRVKFHWMNGSEKSPWLRVITPHAGGGKGMFFIPEVGEEVIVGFEGNSPTKPFIMGSVYNGKAKCSYSNEKNNIKIIQTRSGIKIRFNDKKGELTISDPSGNSIVMHGNGEITIKAPKKLNLNSKEINIKAENLIFMEVSNPDCSIVEGITLSEGQLEFYAKNIYSIAHEVFTRDSDKEIVKTNELEITVAALCGINSDTLVLNGTSAATINSKDTQIF